MLGTSKDIKNPGLRTLPPGVERYLIQGGGINVLEIFPARKFLDLEISMSPYLLSIK